MTCHTLGGLKQFSERCIMQSCLQSGDVRSELAGKGLSPLRYKIALKARRKI